MASAGYEVRTASDGKEGSKLYQAQPPELVITDIYMPNKDGLEVIMELRASFPKTRIIAISGQVTQKNMLPVASTLGASCVRAIGTTPGVFTRRECEAFQRDHALKIERL